MPTLLDDIATAAEWVAAALRSSGYAADGTPESLHEIERFFGAEARPGGLLDEDIGRRLFAIGAYVGEVIRTALGATWVVDDDDPQGEIDVAMRLPDGTLAYPVRLAMTRLKRGEAGSIVAFGRELGVIE